MATVFSTLCLQVQNCVFCQTGTEGISSVPHSEMDAVCQAHLPSQLNPSLSCCSCPHRAASAGAGLQRMPRVLQGLTLYAWLCCSLIAVPKYQMSEYDWSPAPPLPDFRCITEFPKSLCMENMTDLFFSGYYSEKGFAREWTVDLYHGIVVAQGFITARSGISYFCALVKEGVSTRQNNFMFKWNSAYAVITCVCLQALAAWVSEISHNF